MEHWLVVQGHPSWRTELGYTATADGRMIAHMGGTAATDYSGPLQQPLAAYSLANQETLHDRLVQQTPEAEIPDSLWDVLTQLV